MTDQFGDDYDDDFTGEFKGKASGPYLGHKYKVWNLNPQWKSDPQVADSPKSQPITPGIVMKTMKKDGSQWSHTEEIVPVVRAVILFNSSGRQVETREKGKMVIKCSSHDGVHPSMNVKEPFCRDATAADIATLVGNWREMDQAKIEAKVQEVTDGGKLSFCSIKTNSGFITLCPHAKKDPRTGAKAICKQHVFVKAYDLDREREFTMQLTGSSIDTGPKFISPFYEFFDWMRNQPLVTVNGQGRQAPCFVYEVELASMASGAFYLLNVKNYKRLPEEKWGTMKSMAYAAKDAYQKSSMRLSKEEYDKTRKPAVPANKPEAPAVTAPVVNTTVNSVSFDDDDIPF